jgi:riboflavin synthase
MFTGIVEELGEVVRLEAGPASARITVRGPLVTADAGRGDSIAVNGICLTVVDRPGSDAFTADVMLETLNRTSLAGLTAGTRVNLERPMPADGRFGGHVVQGHVDGVGTVTERVPGENWELVRLAVPAALARYVVEKGSLAVDGVSLTVAAVDDEPDGTATVTVSLIPETLERTTLGRRAVGEPVNLEVDVLAKYVERMLGDRVTPAPAAVPVAASASAPATAEQGVSA